MVHRISHDKEMNRVQHILNQKQLKRQLFFSWPRERNMCSIVPRKKEETKNFRDPTSSNSNFENVNTQPYTTQNTTDLLHQSISPSSFLMLFPFHNSHGLRWKNHVRNTPGTIVLVECHPRDCSTNGPLQSAPTQALIIAQVSSNLGA